MLFFPEMISTKAKFLICEISFDQIIILPTCLQQQTVNDDSVSENGIDDSALFGQIKVEANLGETRKEKQQTK